MTGFLDLPRELRDVVYQLATMADPPVVKTESDNTVHLTQRSRLAILCRRVNLEYEEYLAEQSNDLPLHHVSLERFHPRHIKLPALPRKARSIYIVFDLHLNNLPTNQQNVPRILQTSTASLFFHTRRIRSALNKLPLLERYVVEVNVHNAECACAVISQIVKPRSRAERMRSYLFRLADWLGLAGFAPQWASPWPYTSLCGDCRAIPEAVFSDIVDVPLAREEPVMTRAGYGIYHAKTTSNRSKKKMQKQGRSEAWQPRYWLDLVNSVRYGRFDASKNEHEKWAKLMGDLKVPPMERNMSPLAASLLVDKFEVVLGIALCLAVVFAVAITSVSLVWTLRVTGFRFDGDSANVLLLLVMVGFMLMSGFYVGRKQGV